MFYNSILVLPPAVGLYIDSRVRALYYLWFVHGALDTLPLTII